MGELTYKGVAVTAVLSMIAYYSLGINLVDVVLHDELQGTSSMIGMMFFYQLVFLALIIAITNKMTDAYLVLSVVLGLIFYYFNLALWYSDFLTFDVFDFEVNNDPDNKAVDKQNVAVYFCIMPLLMISWRALSDKADWVVKMMAIVGGVFFLAAIMYHLLLWTVSYESTRAVVMKNDEASMTKLVKQDNFRDICKKLSDMTCIEFYDDAPISEEIANMKNTFLVEVLKRRGAGFPGYFSRQNLSAQGGKYYISTEFRRDFNFDDSDVRQYATTNVFYKKGNVNRVVMNNYYWTHIAVYTQTYGNILLPLSFLWVYAGLLLTVLHNNLRRKKA